MWPWAHLAVGYLCYSGSTRLRADRPPTGIAAIAVAFGTQFPDLVDKPLAWTFAVLATGRSLAHSLLTAAILLSALYLVARRWNHEETVIAFATGMVSHPFADYFATILGGEVHGWQFLFWPITRIPPELYTTDQSFLAHFQAFSVTPQVAFGFGLVGLAVVLWIRDGSPGIETVVRATRIIGKRVTAWWTRPT